MIRLTDIEDRVHGQNGEDGIIRHLLARVFEPDRRFLEIGSGKGAENNTTALLADRFRGVAVEAKPARSAGHRDWLRAMGHGDTVACVPLEGRWNRVRYPPLVHADRPGDA